MKKDRNIIKGNKINVSTSQKEKTFYAIIEVKSTKKQLKDALKKEQKDATPKFETVLRQATGSRIVALNELEAVAEELNGRIVHFNAFS